MLRYLTVIVIFCLTNISYGFPFQFSYQGRLTDSNGQPLIGKATLEISFHDSGEPNQGNLLGPGLVTKKVTFQEGVFTVDFDFAPEDYHAIFSDATSPVYIEIKNARSAHSHSLEIVYRYFSLMHLRILSII